MQAGEEALYGAAMPIASQDANTYAESGRFNANAANTAAIANAGFKNEASRFNAGSKNDMSGMLFRTAADFGLEDSRQKFQANESATNRNWQSGERQAQQNFTAAEAAKDREFQAQQQATQFTQTLQRDQILFDNNLKTMVAETEQQLRIIDAQNGTNLSAQYRQATQASYDGFIEQVASIQQSDMDADVKQAQIAQLQSLFQSRQDYINTIFGNMPGWSDEWAQFALEFGGGN